MAATRRPRHVAPMPAQLDNAKCRDADPELFFPDEADHRGRLAAKAFCATCPLIWDCGEWAIANQPDGIWGGTDRQERAQIRNRASKARRRALKAAS